MHENCVGDAYIASRFDLTNSLDPAYKNNMRAAAVATCEVGLAMQLAMKRFQKDGLFAVFPGNVMHIRVGVHTGSCFGTMTGMYLRRSVSWLDKS
jgi:class 3 adenylate cyclase